MEDIIYSVSSYNSLYFTSLCTTAVDELKLQKSSSDSCLLPASHMTRLRSEAISSDNKELFRTCASVPANRKIYNIAVNMHFLIKSLCAETIK